MKRTFLLLFCALCASAFSEWTVLENCRLVENIFNDADSFVVECPERYRGDMKNRFRLYFVDAAETDRNSDFKKDRLKVQADYWGSDDPNVALQMGMRAGQMVSRLLRGGFTVYTQGEYAPTMGAPRYYALIQVKDRWLDEILVEEGLVRIYGQGTALPGERESKTHWNHLRQLERVAKAERRNAWRNASAETVEEESSPEFEPHDTVTSRNAWIYSIKDGRKITVIAKGTAVSVIGEGKASRMRIRFKKKGKVYEGLCEKKSLD